jgi:hypothetical protein
MNVIRLWWSGWWVRFSFYIPHLRGEMWGTRLSRRKDSRGRAGIEDLAGPSTTILAVKLRESPLRMTPIFRQVYKS